MGKAATVEGVGRRALLKKLAAAMVPAAMLRQVSIPRAMSPPVDARLRALLEQYFAAWRQGPDVAARFYAQDADLVFFDLLPLCYRGWSRYRAGVYANVIDKGVGGTVAPLGPAKLRRGGEHCVWMTLLERYVLLPRERRKIVVDARHTMIWERRRGRWLIVHEHISAPMKPFPGAPLASMRAAPAGAYGS